VNDETKNEAARRHRRKVAHTIVTQKRFSSLSFKCAWHGLNFGREGQKFREWNLLRSWRARSRRGPPVIVRRDGPYGQLSPLRPSQPI
jgi:hypothetical protein